MAVRHIRLVAVLLVVVVSLTGFSTKSHGGGKSKSRSRSHSSSGSGGGGCSSSRSNSHSNSGGSSRTTGTGYNSGRTRPPSSSSSSPSARPSSSDVTVVDCVRRSKAAKGGVSASTIEIRNPGKIRLTYHVTLDFYDAAGAVVDSGTGTRSVGAGATVRTGVRMTMPSRFKDGLSCRVSSVY